MISHEIITTKPAYVVPTYTTYHNQPDKPLFTGISVNTSQEVYDEWFKKLPYTIGDVLVRKSLIYGQMDVCSLHMCHIVTDMQRTIPPWNRNNWEGAYPKVFQLLQMECLATQPWLRWEAGYDMIPVPVTIYERNIRPTLDKLRNYLDSHGFTQVQINPPKAG